MSFESGFSRELIFTPTTFVNLSIVAVVFMPLDRILALEHSVADITSINRRGIRFRLGDTLTGGLWYTIVTIHVPSATSVSYTTLPASLEMDTMQRVVIVRESETA